MTAFRLSLLGWTQQEIANNIGVSQSTLNEHFLSEFSKLKKPIKNLLTEGHPHTEIADRHNMPPRRFGCRIENGTRDLTCFLEGAEPDINWLNSRGGIYFERWEFSPSGYMPRYSVFTMIVGQSVVPRLNSTA